ncbi:DUF5343 domain-containing protein [Sphingomonas sp. LB2R24]|uniref:DUF5343 domain-containing protein n=1 Tax=Sphingomonas sorbitolis TaxID=3096165 RepID=UPI002FC5930B
MALPKSYLTSTKNLGAIFESIQQAKAPERFTTRFLESLEFKSAADRLIIGVLKSLGFLDDQGRPTQRYFSFLDQTQSAAILADAVRESYTDIFSVNINAQNLTKSELVNKFKTLSQGGFSESVLDKMATTFQALVKLSDFSSLPNVQDVADNENAESDRSTRYDEEPIELRQRAKPRNDRSTHQPARNLGGLHYNIQIILPETRDPQVYDALFRSLSEHLFG